MVGTIKNKEKQMKNPIKVIQESLKWLLKHWIATTFSAIILSLGGILHLYQILWTFLKISFQLQPPLWAVLALVLVVLIYAYLKTEKLNLLLHPQDKSSNYLFDNHLGISFHKKTKEPFCPSCLASNIEFPLQVYEHGWLCNRKECHQFYSNPDFKELDTPEYQGRSKVTGY